MIYGQKCVSEPVNRHCCVVDTGKTGILIEGPSGSGKTSLALGLVEALQRDNNNAALVADDQALLYVEDGRLMAAAPSQIAGKAELRGYGIIEVSHHGPVAIGLVARLVDDGKIERVPASRHTIICGIDLAMVELPKRHEAQSIRILRAWLGQNSGSD